MEIRVPVYLITGFLESGKTTFIDFTIRQDYFQNDGEETLLISCENGEIEYDEELLKKRNTTLVFIDDKESFTEEELQELEEKYQPDRVIFEFNPLWSVKRFEDMELPDGWVVVQQMVMVDGSTFQVYIENMRSLFAEMSKNADMVIFNRCNRDMPLASFRRSIKAVNPAVDVVFEDESGEINDIFKDAVPYDLNADVIEIEDMDYGIFYMDLIDNHERYVGKVVKFKGQVLKNDEIGNEGFVPGRKAMTCCADDMQFLGFICLSKNASRLRTGQWIELTARMDWAYHKAYGEEGPIFHVKAIVVTKAPECEYVCFS